MATPTIGSRGTIVPVSRSRPRSITCSQIRGSGNIPTNLFGEPTVNMKEVVHRRVEEKRARKEEPTIESGSSSKEDKDPVTLNSNSSEEKERLEILSQLDPVDNPESPPPSRVHRPVTCSTSSRPTGRPKRKASKKKTAEPSNSYRKQSRG